MRVALVFGFWFWSSLKTVRFNKRITKNQNPKTKDRFIYSNTRATGVIVTFVGLAMIL
jgi:hypothetical protein